MPVAFSLLVALGEMVLGLAGVPTGVWDWDKAKRGRQEGMVCRIHRKCWAGLREGYS